MSRQLTSALLLSVGCLAGWSGDAALAQSPYAVHMMQMAAYQRQMQLAAQQRAWQMAAMQNAQRIAAMQHASQVMVAQQQAAYMKQMSLQARQANPQLAAHQAGLQVGGKGIMSASQVPISALQITPQDRALAMQMNHQLTYMVQLAQKETSITGHYTSISQIPGFAAWERMTGVNAFTGQRNNTGFMALGSRYAHGGGVCNASSCGGGPGGGCGGCGGGGCGGGGCDDDGDGA